MTHEEFESEVERLGYIRRDDGLVPEFEHHTTKTRVSYVPARGDCLVYDFERTLAALRDAAAREAGAAGTQPAEAPPPAEEALTRQFGLVCKRGPASLAASLRRFQEATLSSLIGAPVLVSEQAAKGEALEFEPREGFRPWVVIHPEDARAMVHAALGRHRQSDVPAAAPLKEG